MNIILIAEKNHYRDWKGKTYFDILTYYTTTSKNNVKLIYSDHYSKYNIDIIKSFNPNIIVFFSTDRLLEATYFNYVFDIGIPIFYCGLDVFHFDLCAACENIQKCTGLIHFGKCSKIESSYKTYFPKKIQTYFKGRFVNSNIYKNYDNNKDIDILIYGSRNAPVKLHNNIMEQEYKTKYESHYEIPLSDKPNFYPLRAKVETIITRNMDKYKVHILPQATIYDQVYANAELSKLINRAHLTLACTSRMDVPFAKYFEIAASYSCILGNIPTDYTELFTNNIVEISEWMTDDEILNIIDNALENKKELYEKTKRLGDRVHAEYNLDAAVINMDEVITELCK